MVWGPLAGYFARQGHAALTVTPAAAPSDAGVPLVYDVALGLRRGARDAELARRLERALRDERAPIERILDEYGVPRL